MSVTVSEHPSGDGSSMSPYNEKSTHSPEHKEELLGKAKPKPYVHEKLRHTATGLEALGFNQNASMYHHGVQHNYRHYSIDSQDSEGSPGSPKESKEKSKQRVSFIKKLIGNGGKEKERGEKIWRNG